MNDATYLEDTTELPSGRIRVMTPWDDDSVRWFTAELRGLSTIVAEYAVESLTGDVGPDGDSRPSLRAVEDIERQHPGMALIYIKGY